ncbi:hypothetical protein [Virgisporangium aurantiacum]|uniref:Uncharacterized protein n=1 Tax=Virgisporangium aurantiacum TaxID=175570 RepID=A0A8J3ZJU5_9ACTN|nr:hypothetical protein [Virgisporangium aurantiacum]GIJ63300.1 hypothetical protein Vau01_108160 [Virgisporangium aurantiacum]
MGDRGTGAVTAGGERLRFGGDKLVEVSDAFGDGGDEVLRGLLEQMRDEPTLHSEVARLGRRSTVSWLAVKASAGRIACHIYAVARSDAGVVASWPATMRVVSAGATARVLATGR